MISGGNKTGPIFTSNRVFQHLEEFAELLLPVTDPLHQMVEQAVQLLAQRNKDIPEVSEVPWSVHVVESPQINAFVLPVSIKRDTDQKLFFLFIPLVTSVQCVAQACILIMLVLFFFCRMGKCLCSLGCWEPWQIWTSS